MTTDIVEKLLPCPFCGENQTLRKLHTVALNGGCGENGTVIQNVDGSGNVQALKDCTYIATFDPPTVLQFLNLLDEMAGALEAADATLPYDTHLREMAHATIDNALAKYNAWKEKK